MFRNVYCTFLDGTETHECNEALLSTPSIEGGDVVVVVVVVVADVYSRGTISIIYAWACNYTTGNGDNFLNTL